MSDSPKKTYHSSSLVAREEILATAAHDLKNPLGAIFGYADALLDTALGEGLNAQQREVLARVRSISARALDLVRNYQYLSQLELSGQAPKSPTGASDLNFIVSNVVDTTWREDPASLALDLALAPENPQVRVDRVALERIISNLFSNALRYSPRPGVIKIATRVEGQFAVFEIINSGPVIPPEEISRIFERNFRGSTALGTAGSGLGLYIVKRLVDSLGGEIELTSDAARGTAFKVTLPSPEISPHR